MTNGYKTPLYLDDWQLKLDSNENAIGPSPKVIEALRKINDKYIKFYPAYGHLLEKLSAYNNLPVQMLLPTNGADEAINYIFQAFIKPQDTVLTVTPTFVMPKLYANTIGCTYKEIPYTEKWVFPVDELIKNIDPTVKLILITTPNNPTGEAISGENLLKILQAAENSYVLIDETYFNYCGKTFKNLLNNWPNIIITRSMSKDFALAGLRIGYLMTSEENINCIRKIISPYSVNNIAATAACAALDDIDHLDNVVKNIKESKQLLEKGLKPYAKKIYRSDANFLLVDFGDKADFIYKKLLNSGIKVKHFEKTSHLEDCLRITVPDITGVHYILDTLKPRELIIFDMDGVLADTSNSYRLAIQGVYEKISGSALTKDQIQQAKNRGGLNNDWELTLYLLEQDGFNVPFDRIVGEFQELYKGKDWDGFIRNEKLLLDPKGIAQLARKYDLAIFTGRPKPEAEFFLRHNGIEQYFYPVITMDDVPKGCQKPNPWGVYEIMRVVEPLKAYYLGDTVDDMFAARQAKVTGIGVLPPQDTSDSLKQALKAHGAADIIERTEDILDWL